MRELAVAAGYLLLIWICSFFVTVLLTEMILG